MAGTSLKNVLMQMTVPGSKLSKVFGGTVNNFEEFVAVLKKTKEQGGLTKTQLGMIPRLLQATIPVLIDSSDKMMAYKQSLDDAGGSAERMAEIQMATLEGKMLTLNSATEGLGISFFETFDDVLKGAVDGVISLVSALDSLIAVPMSAQLEENRTSAEGLFQVLERGNLTSETRKRLLDEINTKYGDLITTELTEVSTLGDIKKAHDEITGSIIKQIAVEQSREKIAKIMQGISDLRDREVGLISKQLNAENRLTTETTKHTEALSKAKVKQEEYNKTHGHSSAMMNQGRTAMTMQIEELENLQQATGYQTNASELSGIAMANAGFAYENTTDAVVRNQMEQYNLIQSMGDVQRKAEELAESLTNIATASGGGGSGKYDETAILLEFADVEEQIHFKKLQQIADQEAKYMDLNINKVAVMEWSAQQEKKLDAEVLASKMSYFSGLSGALSKLAGEHKQGALVAKRLAQVQAVIDTWAGANKALASAPPPWNFIAMATVIATGMANVANIESQTMAQGGFISGNSHAQGGVNINAEGGEFMMQRDAVSRIGVDTLSNMNEGGGGGITLNISAPLIDDTIIDVIVPAIDRARREGLA